MAAAAKTNRSRTIPKENGGREIEEAHCVTILYCDDCGNPHIFLRDKDDNIFASAAVTKDEFIAFLQEGAPEHTTH